MKKFLLAAILVFAFLLVLVSCNDTDETAPIGDITVAVGQSYKLADTVNADKVLEYTYESESFKIENGMLTGISESEGSIPVCARADGFEVSFSVTVIDAGTMKIDDLSIGKGSSKRATVIFSDKDSDYDVSYSFSGDNISIDKDGRIRGLKSDTVTAVTATTKYHTAVFIVTVLPESYGELVIDAPSKIYTNFPGKDVVCTFTEPRFTSEVKFTSNDSRVSVKDGKILAKGAFETPKEVTITANTEHHSVMFKVTVSEYTANFGNLEKRLSDYENDVIKTAQPRGMIFIGDSYFDAAFWSDFYDDWSDTNAYRMGISQSGINDWEVISERLVYPMKPTEIVAHIGFNDVHHSGISAYELADRLITLFEEYREKLPGVTVYYFGIEPKKNSHNESNQYYYSSFVKAPQVNEIMKRYAEANSWFVYLDSPSFCFNSDGTVKSSFYLTTDLSHPTLESYELYEAMLRSARSARSVTPVCNSYIEVYLDKRKELEEYKTSV